MDSLLSVVALGHRVSTRNGAHLGGDGQRRSGATIVSRASAALGVPRSHHRSCRGAASFNPRYPTLTLLTRRPLPQDPEPLSGAAYSERVGTGQGPKTDVALDALEGASTCATGGYNAMAVIAIADEGTVLRVPDTYMDKIACGPHGRGVVDLDRSPTENLRRLAEAKGMYVEDLTVVILDRPRHQALIDEVRRAGARIKLISDGDVSAALATTKPEAGVDILMGIGRAPQGILAAAALVCLGGEMQARIKPRNESDAAALRQLGLFDFNRKYRLEELASGSVMFAATGVTQGDYLDGVRYVKGGGITNSVVMRSATRTVRLIEAHHRFDRHPQY